MRSISSELLRLFLVHSTLLFLTANCTYRFSEELLVDPLHDSFVQFYFEFKSDLEINHSNFVENYELFPKRIGDIAKKFEINELSLKLSQGTWRYEEWGSPITSAPSGGELWARFESENQDQVDSNWLKSSRAISGLFGLSINLEENPNTIIPKHTNISNNIRYASIPNEIVCTENLTPWLKLLPCGSYKGLAQLFKSSPRLFESHYFMARLHFIRICMDQTCTIEKLELRQTLTVVYDINSIIRQMTTDQLSYSFSNVFLKTVDGFCPVAYLSKVYVNLRNDAVAISLQSNEQFYSEIMKSKVDVFDLIELFKTSREFNPVINQKRVKNTLKSIVSIHRYITDINERNFGLKTLIRNDFSERLSIVYLDAIPWYFRVYISTLVVMDEKKNIWIKPDVVHFVPGLDRKRPHHIELKLNLEPKSVYSIYFKAEFAYLKWDEFPPDVNHGFYINPAVVEIDFNDNLKHLTHYRYPYLSTNIYENLKYKYNTNRNMKIYSETLLMNLPTPDFSMPYNVICLTCTVIAIGFGSIHNFTTRRFIFLESTSLKDKIKRFFKRG